MIHHQFHAVRPDRVHRPLPRRLLADGFVSPCRRLETTAAGPLRRAPQR
jgi:hypothetical protein